MNVVLLVAAVAQPFLLTAVVAMFQRTLRNERRESTNERRLLTNQLLNSVGRPWQPAPADERRGSVEDELETWGRYTPNPEQLPVE